jgi:hypothetical protein
MHCKNRKLKVCYIFWGSRLGPSGPFSFKPSVNWQLKAESLDSLLIYLMKFYYFIEIILADYTHLCIKNYFLSEHL